MKRWIIKKHYIASETNLNFKGVKKDFYDGKGGYSFGEKFPSNFFIEEEGYTTLASAKRGLNSAERLAQWETDLGHWTVTVELIACEV